MIPGAPIGMGDFGLDWCTGFFVAMGLALLVPCLTRARDRVPMLGLWLVKVFVALGPMLLYEAHYADVDAVGYFQAAIGRTFDTPVAFGHGTELVGWLSWLIARVLPHSYHAIKIVFSFVGLWGIYLFYRAAVRATGREDLRLLAVLALTPSVLFWSSILGKDPPTLFGIALVAYGVVAWERSRKPRHLLTIALGLTIAAAVRLWLGLIFGVPVAGLLFTRVRNPVTRLTVLAVAAALIPVAFGAVRTLLFRESATDLLSAANQFNFADPLQTSGPNFGDLGSVVRFLPLGMFTALFRPLPGEVMNPFGLLAGLEDLALLGLAALATWRISWHALREPLVRWALVTLLLWAGVYGIISSQNLGTAVRFRLQVLPLLVLLCLHLRTARSSPSRALRGSSSRSAAS